MVKIGRREFKRIGFTDYWINEEERNARLKNNGPNKIEEKEQVQLWRKVAKHFTDLLMIVLIVAALLKFATGEVVEGGIIFLVWYRQNGLSRPLARA